MEQPGEANAIRLWSQNGAYVVAHDDKETVGESDDGSSPNAKWLVERVQGKPKVIRLKSCFGRYLTASDGKMDWEPICDDGVHVKLKLLLVNEEPKSQNRAVSVMRWVGELLQGCCEPSHQNWVFWHVEDDTSSSSSAWEPDFEVENSMLAPLLQIQFNPTDTRELYGNWRDCVQVSYKSGQPNRPITLDAEQLSASQLLSYDSGQPDSQLRSVREGSSAPRRSNDFGQLNSP